VLGTADLRPVAHQVVQRVDRGERSADDLVGHDLSDPEILGVSVGFPDAGHTGVRLELDNGPWRERLMHPDHIEQWWVTDQDGCAGGADDDR